MPFSLQVRPEVSNIPDGALDTQKQYYLVRKEEVEKLHIMPFIWIIMLGALNQSVDIHYQVGRKKISPKGMKPTWFREITNWR